MSSFKWSKHNAVYLPEFDQEHKSIFRMAEQLYQALLAGARLRTVEPLLRELSHEAQGHFKHEEEQMRSVRYPQFAWHKRQHDTVRAKVTEIKRCTRRGDREAVLEGVEFLGSWLRGHTAVTDRMMTAYLRDYARSHS